MIATGFAVIIATKPARAMASRRRQARRPEERGNVSGTMTFEQLLEQARALGPMTDEQRREQAANFAFGQLALTKEWHGRPLSELAELRALCRKMAGLRD